MIVTEATIWRPIHIFLVQNQNLIKRFFFLTYAICVFLIVLGFYLFKENPDLYIVLYSLAGKVGTIALVLFLGALLPGIFQRFKFLPLVSASIVLFRRQIGILMFFCALVHSMYISTIPAIMSGITSLDELPPNALTGMLTIIILFPVWITSNDISQKKLGKFWKTIQRLTYFAMITIFFHVAMIEKSAAVLTITVFALEIASWVKIWFFTSKQRTV